MAIPRNAFTMVEMLVVVAIIAVVVTVPLLAYNSLTRNARDGRRKQDMDKVKTALLQYRAENGSYPVADDWGELEDILVPNFMAQLPEDPISNSSSYGYTYSSDSTGAGFTLSSPLEDREGGEQKVYVVTPNGPQTITGTPPIPSATGTSFAGGGSVTPPFALTGTGNPYPTDTPRATTTRRPSRSPTPTRTPTPTDPPVRIMTTLDSAGMVGKGASVALAADGLPMIAYYDADVPSLKFIKCGNAACNSGNTVRTLGSAGPSPSNLQAGYMYRTSIQRGADDFPIIAYANTDIISNLFVADCSDATCSSVALYEVDGDYGAGLYADMIVGTNGRPVISYYHEGYDFKILACNTTTCNSGYTIAYNDLVDEYSNGTSIALGSDGLPFVAFNFTGANSLYAKKCANANCFSYSSNFSTIIDGVSGIYSDITMNGNGFPVISYYDSAADNLKLRNCVGPRCDSAGDSTVTLDSTGDVGSWNAIALRINSYPVVAYAEVTAGSDTYPTAGNLKFLVCGNANCSSGNTIRTIDTGAGQYNGIVIPADGNPFIAYYDYVGENLKAIKCGDPTCYQAP
jgi:prepilin-type N-terminal cleavage/methylation domain-containing protein